jgi:hypothetical protein
MNKSLLTTFSFSRTVTLMIKKDKTDEIDRDERIENRGEDENDDENDRARREDMKI